MTDQVSPVGGLASGLPVALSSTAAAAPAQGSDRSAKIADNSSQGQAPPTGVTSSGTPGQAVDQVNSHLKQANSELRMQVDTATGRTIYQVVDPTTGQVVLQVPSAQVLAMAHSLQTLDKQMGASGVLLDKKG